MREKLFNKVLRSVAIALVFGGVAAYSQIFNEGMEFDPIEPADWADTAQSDGYIVLFDGTKASLQRNWWVSDRAHGDGGRWWVAPSPELVAAGYLDEGDSVLFSMQNPGGEGGILCTHKTWEDYEARVSCLPGFGNDGGFFMRTNGGRAWQIVIDYRSGARMMEFFDEGTGSGSERLQTYWIWNNGTTIKEPDRFSKPWLEIWNIDGLNWFWAKMQGAVPTINSSINDEPVMVNWKGASQGNLPILGYFGLQIHFGGLWGDKPNLYGWAGIRPLDVTTGEPKYAMLTTTPAALGGGNATFSVTSSQPAVTYQWQRNGVDIPGANSAEITVPEGDFATGVYTALASNALGLVTRSNPPAGTSDPTRIGGKGMLETGARSLRTRWNGDALEIIGSLTSRQTVRVTDMSGRVLFRESIGAGTFVRQTRLNRGGVYAVSLEEAPSKAARKITSLKF